MDYFCDFLWLFHVITTLYSAANSDTSDLYPEVPARISSLTSTNLTDIFSGFFSPPEQMPR
jgi:hypothetical protein